MRKGPSLIALKQDSSCLSDTKLALASRALFSRPSPDDSLALRFIVWKLLTVKKRSSMQYLSTGLR